MKHGLYSVFRNVSFMPGLISSVNYHFTFFILVNVCQNFLFIFLFFILFYGSRAFFDKRISQEVSGDALGEVCVCQELIG